MSSDVASLAEEVLLDRVRRDKDVRRLWLIMVFSGTKEPKPLFRDFKITGTGLGGASVPVTMRVRVRVAHISVVCAVEGQGAVLQFGGLSFSFLVPRNLVSYIWIWTAASCQYLLQ